jgi:large subunit ribosomal protein L13
MKTYSAKPSDITKKWYILDASEITLGRLSTKAADLLIGKSKPTYTAHIDGGDYVIVINAENLQVTGDKLEKKIYYRHSQYPGGLKSETLKEKLQKDATEVISHSVRGMLPVNKLRDERLKRLKVYTGKEHPHAPQNPEVIKLKGDK